jgi:AraC-like DNA-binding protein
MDVLSEIFSALRLEAGLYFSTCFRGEFAVRLAGERRRIRFHLVLEGSCVVTVPDQAPVRLSEGDLALIPEGAPQVLSSGEDINGALDLDMVLSRMPPVGGILHFGEEGDLCRLLCGFLRFDEAISHPVLENLPPLIVMPQPDGNQLAGITAALALLRAEAGDQGAGQVSIVLRTVEILLMQAARHRLSDPGPESGGFASALSDPRLYRALRAIHSQFEQPWDVDGLASVAGMSRSRFAHWFIRSVGMTPMAYLTRWRMIRARQLLSTPGLDLAEIAERCGYRSVPAFGRRFAQIYGVGPGTWRKRARSGENEPN